VSFGSGDSVNLGVGGWIGNWELWQQPFEILSAHGLRTIAYDHYGAGETTAPIECLKFDSHVECVFRLLDHFGIERCVIAGESIGGTVALAAATREPMRFRGVIVVDAPVHGFDNDVVRQFADALRADFGGTIASFVDFCIPEPASDQEKRRLRRILMDADPEVAIALLEAMYDVDLRPSLSSLGVPVQLIHGELDQNPHNRLSDAEATAHLLGDAPLHVVKGAGHVPTLTRPTEVADAMASFISRLPL
jgi:pimeloyl-ACP methyl ester carboxylesterase